MDVGQGASQVLLLGGGKAIVIDGGTSGHGVTVKSLKALGVSHIPRLIVSHNHKDHCGGIVDVLASYEECIDEVWFLDDGALKRSNFGKRVQQQLADGTLRCEQLRRLECDGGVKTVYDAPTGEVSLWLAAPTTGGNFSAVMKNRPNETSAVLLLLHYNNRVLFTSDANVNSLRDVKLRIPKLRCDVLTVPHHGGSIAECDAEDLSDFFRSVLPTRFAVVSVGSSNDYGHPKEAVVLAARSAGVEILCTQITPNCCCDLESIRPGVTVSNEVGLSSLQADISVSGKSKNVACAGTVVAELSPSGVAIRRHAVHAAGVNKLVALSHRPLCRRAS